MRLKKPDKLFRLSCQHGYEPFRLKKIIVSRYMLNNIISGSVAKIGFEIQVYSSIFKDFPGKIQGFSWI